jgi:hypothetical protein
MNRVIFTGSRHFTHRWVVRSALQHLDPETDLIVHGDALGLDTIAAEEATNLGFTVEAWPADWKIYGKAAGPIRNQAMIDAGADLVVAFPLGDSVGTRDCVARALKARIPVDEHEWWPPDPQQPDGTLA